MFRPLLSLVLAAAVATASASASASILPVPPMTSGAPASSPTGQIKLQSQAKSIKVSTLPVAGQGRGVAPHSEQDQASTNGSGWRAYGTPLSALVLMAIIAFRRRKADRH